MRNLTRPEIRLLEETLGAIEIAGTNVLTVRSFMMFSRRPEITIRGWLRKLVSLNVVEKYVLDVGLSRTPKKGLFLVDERAIRETLGLPPRLGAEQHDGEKELPGLPVGSDEAPEDPEEPLAPVEASQSPVEAPGSPVEAPEELQAPVTFPGLSLRPETPGASPAEVMSPEFIREQALRWYYEECIKNLVLLESPEDRQQYRLDTNTNNPFKAA